MASPSLSSIELDCETIGFRAAALLDRLISGSPLAAGSHAGPLAAGSHAGPASAAPARKRIIPVPPKEVVERESTRVFSCADPLVEQAIRAIRSRAAQGATAAAILAELPASRRSAEIRFRRATGRSIREEILRVRLARATTLLRSTNLTVAAVAAECGFASAQRFHEAFRKGEGVSPGAFRKDRRSQR
jgi:LacI family transcriptional regulator